MNFDFNVLFLDALGAAVNIEDSRLLMIVELDLVIAHDQATLSDCTVSD